MKINFKKLALVSFVSSSALLAACGGDPSLTVSGTAATGLAVVGTVTATCKSGSGTASSNASGSYTVTITNGEGPCLIKVVSGSTTLYSVSSGTGATQIANVTPLTNLFVNYLLNAGSGAVPASPEDWFAAPATTTFLASTPSVTAQVANFIPFVQAYALTLPGAPVIVVPTTFLSTVFAAGAAPTANADDEALEALGAAGVWDATGTPDADVITAVVTETEQTVLTVLTGTTGAGG